MFTKNTHLKSDYHRQQLGFMDSKVLYMLDMHYLIVNLPQLTVSFTVQIKLNSSLSCQISRGVRQVHSCFLWNGQKKRGERMHWDSLRELSAGAKKPIPARESPRTPRGQRLGSVRFPPAVPPWIVVEEICSPSNYRSLLQLPFLQKILLFLIAARMVS